MTWAYVAWDSGGRIPNNFATLPDGSPISAAVGSPEAAVEAMEVLGDFAIGIEGPNEPDIFYDDYQYDGFTNTANDLAASREYHNDLFIAIKGDPDTAHLPVLTPSLADIDALPALGQVPHDKINIHYYPESFIGSDSRPLNGSPDSFAETIHATIQHYAPNDPLPHFVLTETGYNTSPGDPVVPGRLQGMSELAAGKYAPRMIADLFQSGSHRSGD